MEIEENSTPSMSTSISSRNIAEPTSYTRKELLRLSKSPLVRVPDSLEPFSVWFGEYTAPTSTPAKPSITSPNASSPNSSNTYNNRFRRNYEDADSPRPSKFKAPFERSSSYNNQPSTLAAYKSPGSRHPEARPYDRESEYSKNKFSTDKSRNHREDRPNKYRADEKSLGRKDSSNTIPDPLKSNDGDWRKGTYGQERQRTRRGKDYTFEDDSSPAWMDDTAPRDDFMNRPNSGPFGSGSTGVDSIQAFKAQMREKERRERLLELGIEEPEAEFGATIHQPSNVLPDEDQVDAANDETFGADAPLEPAMSGLTMNDDPAILNSSNLTSQAQSPSNSQPKFYTELGSAGGAAGSTASSEGTPKVAEKTTAASRFAKFFDAKPKSQQHAMDAQAKWLDAQRRKEEEQTQPSMPNEQPDMQRVLAMLQTSSNQGSISSTPIPRPASVKDISRPTSAASAGADLTSILQQQQQQQQQQQAAFRNQQLQQQQHIIMQQRKEREQELQREKLQREHQALLLAQTQRRQQSPQDPAILNALSLARAKGSPAAMSPNVMQQQARVNPMNDPRAVALQEYQMRLAYERQRQLQQNEVPEVQPEVTQQKKLQEMLMMQQQQHQLRQMQQANAMRGAPPEHLAALIRGGGGNSQSPSNASNPQASALLMQQIQQQQGQVPSTISPSQPQQHSQANEMLLQQQRLLAQQRGMQAAQAQAQAQAAALAAAIQQQQQQQSQQQQHIGGFMHHQSQQQPQQQPDIHSQYANNSFEQLSKMGGLPQPHIMDAQQQRQKQAQLMALLNGGR
ncbi:hypothetical protein WALSEDRAFT_60423 [Wallemia mellicola CBS 633.66]|uniref:Uncharacterized protein n=1 Tax=Wallemia mellicola (strain ATCC MYA-4683 / CBS 633.66) TaxID=671144 RepID=I4YBS9_WALMC|nr:hypothetical protein WALSEDRAFT_60423 [Wallemia mellicola CBS 633.66]EIM21421.1 hypothetical protein WALSEDRAFT_60423 [Wallemia mellicola CBS 633.66]|eukprot:XP_006958452.1 hypothetical protein WALSEDRAFT_60423 [Wallemia mellicola CBS 633.66]